MATTHVHHPVRTTVTFTDADGAVPSSRHPGTRYINRTTGTEIVDTGSGWATATPAGSVSPSDHAGTGEVLVWNYDPKDIGGVSGPSSGILILLKLDVPFPMVATGVRFGIGAAAITPTASSSHVSLYTCPGDGTAARLATGPIADATLETATSVPEVDFAASYTISTPGYYYVGILQAAGTPATLARSAVDGTATLSRAALTQGQALTGAPRCVAYGSGLTASPATLDIENTGSITNGSCRLHWVALVGTPV